MNCPNCSTPIASADVAADGKALCRTCGRRLRLRTVELHDPPPDDCHVSRDGHAVTIIASNQRRYAVFGLGAALAVLLIGTLWIGGASYRRSGSLAPLFKWPPELRKPYAPLTGASGSGLTDQGHVFVVLQGVATLAAAGVLMGLGRVEVHARQDQFRVRSGLPPVAWSRLFQTQAVRWIRVGRDYAPENADENDADDAPAVEMRVNERLVRFGRCLSPRSREWLVRTMAAELRISKRRT